MRHDEVMLVAIGIDDNGAKHLLGLPEGASASLPP